MYHTMSRRETLGISLVLLVLVACAPPPAAPATSAPAVQTTAAQRVGLTVGVTGNTADAPLYIAQERGYMKEEGLDLKLVFMQNAAGLQALIANQVQFSGSGSSARPFS